MGLEAMMVKHDMRMRREDRDMLDDLLHEARKGRLLEETKAKETVLAFTGKGSYLLPAICRLQWAAQWGIPMRVRRSFGAWVLTWGGPGRCGWMRIDALLALTGALPC